MNPRRQHPRSIEQVAERHLCTGCGVCAYLEPDVVRMVDAAGHGRRPLVVAEINGRSVSTPEAVRACPGARVEHEDGLPAGHLQELGSEWGPVLAMWEGWASDPELRHAGSSGGTATALSVHCLEDRAMHGVLHTAPRTDLPFLNRTVLSTTRAELLAGSGSRYAPASPCERLDLIERSPGDCAFVGKPCDVAGARNAAALRPVLAQKLALTIAVFCAGTPTTEGTLAAIRAAGMEPADVKSVRYRGNGWPGRFVVTGRSGDQRSLSYEESWGQILQKHRQWRCMICPDHTGEFADIAVGDPWYREIEPGEAGRSLVLARTERGRASVLSAIASGRLVLTPVSPEILPRSQPNLLTTRGAVWGRTTAMRAMMLPAPHFRKVPTFAAWTRLSPRQQLQSFAGTVRRIIRRRLYRRRPVQPVTQWDPQRDPES